MDGHQIARVYVVIFLIMIFPNVYIYKISLLNGEAKILIFMSHVILTQLQHTQ